MNAEQIRDTSGGVSFWLREIAAQLAEANQIARAIRPKGTKQAATTSIPSSVRRSSTSKRFYIERWKTAVEASMMPEFAPKDGFKDIDDLLVDEWSEGRLGNDHNGKVKRIQ